MLNFFSVALKGVDVNSTIVWKFKDGALCTMISSATCSIPKVIQIIGSAGSIEVRHRAIEVDSGNKRSGDAD